MKRNLLTLLIFASVLILGMTLGGCDDSTSDKAAKQPAEKGTVAGKSVAGSKGNSAAKPAKIPAEKQHAADLMNLSSAVGALQHCRDKEIYVGSPDIADDSFYRLAGVMRPLLGLDEDTELGSAARVGYGMYQTSGNNGVQIIISIPTENNPEHKYRMVQTAVGGIEECKMVEKALIVARQKGGILDVKPALPVSGKPQTDG